MKEIFEFIQNKMPLGAMVFDENMRVIYYNSTAAKFLRRYGIVCELTARAEKILRERRAADTDAFSKDRSFDVASGGEAGNLTIRYIYSEEPFPRISVFIGIKPCNRQLNVEKAIGRFNLTKKEAEVLRQLVRGLKNTDMARELHMQENTLRGHLRNIYAKCGVKSKMELVRNMMT